MLKVFTENYFVPTNNQQQQQQPRTKQKKVNNI